MPYQGTPWIRNNLLKQPGQQAIAVGSSAWFAWLQNATTFCYHSPTTYTRVTLRKEKRRHQFYWYAYLKRDLKLHNIYVGKTETLTVARLQQVADTLMNKARHSQLPIGDG